MRGLDQIGRQLIMLEAALVAAAMDGATKAAEHVLGVSNEHVPHEEGTLERSGKVSVDDSSFGRTTAAISYDTPYAVAQHERMDLEHDPGRTAKYLENALNSERGTAQKIIATSAQTMLKRAGRRR